ncbi:hypothetical protein B0H12DRAFT_1066263 [Mycena haematopus]|nr:hypothetical protein B0H12DRAFT_1066263 [Mycena haematopus]
MNPKSAFRGGHHPSTSKHNDTDESLQEIYPQRRRHEYETTGSGSSIKRVSGSDNTHGSLREIYPQRPRHEYETSGSGSSIPRVYRHGMAHEYFQEGHPHLPRTEHRIPHSEFSLRPGFVVPEPSPTAPEYRSSDSSDSDFVLRPVSPEPSPAADASRPTARSTTMPGVPPSFPVNAPTAAYFSPNAGPSSRMQNVPPLNPDMSSSSSDSEDEDHSSRDASSSSSRYFGRDDQYTRNRNTFHTLPPREPSVEIPILDIRAPALSASSGFPQMPSAARSQSWAAPAVLPESGEPRHVQDAHLGFKRFVCDICYKTFAQVAILLFFNLILITSTFHDQKVNMQTHRHTHTGETPHHCRYNCGESFGDPAKRTRHYKDTQSNCYQNRKAKQQGGGTLRTI